MRNNDFTVRTRDEFLTGGGRDPSGANIYNCFEAAYLNNENAIKRFFVENPKSIDQQFQEPTSRLWQFGSSVGVYVVKVIGIAVMIAAAARGLAPGTTGAGKAFWAWAFLGGGNALVCASVENSNLINRVNREGWTPLHFAALGNSKEAALALISLGANTDNLEFLELALSLGYNDFATACFKEIKTKDTSSLNQTLRENLALKTDVTSREKELDAEKEAKVALARNYERSLSQLFQKANKQTNSDVGVNGSKAEELSESIFDECSLIRDGDIDDRNNGVAH